jgi:hypothetical protein
MFCTLGCALTLLVVFSGPTAVYPQPEDIFIDHAAGYGHKSRPGVSFPHERHMDAHECLDCHHDYKNGENILGESDLTENGRSLCTRCHIRTAAIDLETAYHRQCMGCHRAVNKIDGEALPITCQDCHPKGIDDVE